MKIAYKFSNYLGFDEIKWLCGFVKYTKQKNNSKATIYVNELILAVFILRK